MTHMGLKLTLAGVLFAGAVAYLAFSGMQKGWAYTLGVDSYLAAPAAQQAQRVRLAGRVSPTDVQFDKARMTARFALLGEKGAVQVAYKGMIPDLFKPGAEVLVEGQRDAAGVFVADTMMTKCASKYEEAPKGHPAERKQAATEKAGSNP